MIDNTVNLSSSGNQPKKFLLIKKGRLFVGLIIFFLTAFTFIGFNYFHIINLNEYSPIFSFLPVQNKTLIKVGSQIITQNDVNKEIALTWGRYTKKELKNPKSQKQALDNLINKAILSQEAVKLGITVPQKAVDSKIWDQTLKYGGPNGFKALLKLDNWTENDTREKIKTRLLQDAVKEKVIAWRLISYAGIFRNPTDSKYQEEKKQAHDKLQQIRESLLAGKNIEEATSEAKNKLPVVQALFFESQKQVKKTDLLTPVYLAAIFQARKEEVTEIIESDGGSMMVFKILDENNTNYDSYELWLTKMKSQYIK